MLDNTSGILGLDTRAAPGVSVEDEDVMIIASSGLFDDKWYIAENSDVARSGINPLIHYVRFGAAEGRVPFKGFNAARYLANVETQEKVSRNPLAHYILHGCPEDLLSKGLLDHFSIQAIKTAVQRLAAMPIFRVEDYLALNEDVKPAGGNMDVGPANHALVYGFPEGRSVFMKTTVARAMGAAAAKPFPAAAAMPLLPKLMPHIGVFYNSGGNSFLREIAEDIVSSITGAGHGASLLDETTPIDSRPRLCIFVAPHEFFHLGEGREWAREDILKDALLFTTEQPQTLWFERAMPFVLMARGVIDIAWQVADLFKQAGVPATFFNPNIQESGRILLDEDLRHPLLRVLPRHAQAPEFKLAPFAKRPIDISFFGGESEHREKFFTRNAKFFADYEAFLYYRKVESPLIAKGTHAGLSRIAGHVGAHSKISLNIHRDSNGFFEWHRIVKLAIAKGCVVVSEPCPPHPVFKPGVHYFEESGRHILNLLEWLLKTEEGAAAAQQVQNNALAAARDPSLAARNAQVLLGFVNDLCVAS